MNKNKIKLLFFIYFFLLGNNLYSEDIFRNSIKNHELSNTIANGSFWGLSLQDIQKTFYPNEWKLISGRGRKKVLSLDRELFPEVFDVTPFQFQIQFNENNYPEELKINLWNKGDSELNKESSEKNVSLKINLFFENLKKNRIIIDNKTLIISTKIKLKYSEIIYGSTVWKFFLEKGEFITVRLNKHQAETDNIVSKNIKIKKRIDRNEIKENLRLKLKENLVKRKNGDMLIIGIPMIDQGEKGYCAPAACSRIIQYYGFKGDEHIMAKVMGTEAYGTSIPAIKNSLKAISSGLPLYAKEIKFTKSQIERYIQKGMPIVWGIRYPRHLRLITGYNWNDGDVIFSDSWGEVGIEQKMKYEKAKSLTGLLAVLK